MTNEELLAIQKKITAIDPTAPTGAAQSLRYIALLLSESLIRRYPRSPWPHTSTKE